jgi:hypothetical protein
MSKPRFTDHTLVTVLVLTGALSAAAAAGDRCHRRCDVDIESLRGELWRSGGEWLLEVRYDIEVEDCIPSRGELELVFYVTEHSRQLVDHAGDPIEFFVPLDHPSEVDDDEVEFENRVAVTLPEGVFCDPDRLRLQGFVFRIGDERPLARRDKSIKYKRPKPPRHTSLSVGIGVGTGTIWTASSYGSLHRHRVVRHRLGVRRACTTGSRLRIGVDLGRSTIGRCRPPWGAMRLGSRLRVGHTLRRAVSSSCRSHPRIRLRR